MQFSMQAVLGMVFIATIAIDIGLTCPQGHGCFRQPTRCGETGAAMCNVFASWKANNATGIDFFLRGKNNGTNPRWMAIGFSQDMAMDADDILICRQTSSGVVLEHYWSYKVMYSKTIAKETATLSEDGLSNIQTSFQDGYFACNFTRAVMVSGQAHVYDLSENRYYFIGEGSMGGAGGNVPSQHKTNPTSSPGVVNYTVAGEIGAAGGADSAESSEHDGDNDEDEDGNGEEGGGDGTGQEGGGDGTGQEGGGDGNGQQGEQEGGGGSGDAGHIMASMLLLLMMACLAIFIN